MDEDAKTAVHAYVGKILGLHYYSWGVAVRYHHMSTPDRILKLALWVDDHRLVCGRLRLCGNTYQSEAVYAGVDLDDPKSLTARSIKRLAKELECPTAL